MKKISLLLVLFLFGCQSLGQKLNVQVISDTPKPAPSQPLPTLPPTHDQFESRGLNTKKSDEKKIKVALFLPFSGKNKELGWHLFNAATMSLFENDVNHNIELILIDSKDSPTEATKTFKEVVNRKIKIVIGPIFTSSVEAVEKDAKANGITVIALSNNQKLMGKINNDGGIFLGGMMPEAQIDKVVGYALRQGKYTFSLIAPNNQYGTTVNSILRKIVKDRDGKMVTAEFYEPGYKDLERLVDNVVNAFTLSSKRSSKLKKDGVVTESDRTYSQVIVIPESGEVLAKIAALIKQKNVDERNFQLVGTNQWDDISTFNNPNLLGGWFAAPESERFYNFEKTYYQTYSKFPPRISSIVYDSVSAITKLIDYKKGQTPTIVDFTSYSPLPKNSFEGIDGLFRFLPNGLVQRNLAVLQVGNGRFETVDKPADKLLKY
jgi:branched-chain amino acid transport system substrate-binding protein